MADYKGRIRPPVYDGEGTATYPRMFFTLRLNQTLVKDPVSGETVAQQMPLKANNTRVDAIEELKLDNIQGTTQYLTFNNDGSIQKNRT